MIANNVFAQFSMLMQTRLSTPILTTEDSVVFTFCVALLTHANVQPHEIILEYPHPVLPDKEVDAYLPSLSSGPVAIEFKYNRSIPSGRNKPETQEAGKLFNDIYRLCTFTASPEPERLLVYCTDQIMAKYFRNPRNGYGSFFDLRVGQTMEVDKDFVDSKAMTFRREIGGSMSATLGCLWTGNLPEDHYLRILKVVPTNRK